MHCLVRSYNEYEADICRKEKASKQESASTYRTCMYQKNFDSNEKQNKEQASEQASSKKQGARAEALIKAR